MFLSSDEKVESFLFVRGDERLNSTVVTAVSARYSVRYSIL